ncbi:MAG: glycoside hydrolase family 172 protein [Luteolibacter sp.]|uniref:glycoside hydrolase family 172 protein n=1 Tax=Luteolibacter sp. TaxID=1962973 RepID=UPI003267CE43
MKPILKFSSALAFAVLPLQAAPPVTLESLLAEMTDFESVARWPEPEFTCLQASSYDRRTVAPDQPGWFANDDHTQYIRTEETAGRRENVMMEDDGPGCIVRLWVTTIKNKKGVLRVYLDENPEPALFFPAFDLLAGDLKLGESLAIPHPGYSATDNGGNTLMLPIPYAKHCKVTWEEQGEGPRYYQINFRKYAAGTNVETFTTASFEAAGPSIQRTNKVLSAPPSSKLAASFSKSTTIPAGGEVPLDLPAGPAAVKMMELRLEPNDAAALRSLIVLIQFDGKETVWCPASDFFGSGAGLNELKSWYRSVLTNGTMTCRWTMPYAKTGRITLFNAGKHPVKVQLQCQTGSWKWDDRSMYFHSAWHYESNLTTPPSRDWNFIRLAGRGVYVGDTLSLFNPVATWYGEGDEKIRVDGEAVPSHLGTGTEDYYGYSFAPRGIMQTPFSNQTRIDQEMTQGHNVLTRTRNLDGIPFRKSLDFDIELISWKPTRLTYAATTHWYAFPGGSSNRVHELENATAPIPTLAEAQAPTAPFPGAIDAELLKVAASTLGIEVKPQDMEPFGGVRWSRGAQLLAKAGKVGDFTELEIPAPDSASHKLFLIATQAPDYGILKFIVNDQPVTAKFDGYAGDVRPAEKMLLGTFKPQNGRIKLRIEVSAANPAAVGAKFYFGIDYLLLERP